MACTDDIHGTFVPPICNGEVWNKQRLSVHRSKPVTASKQKYEQLQIQDCRRVK